jgi:alpha-tubulin suppressor-like RCC1 family protein
VRSRPQNSKPVREGEKAFVDFSIKRPKNSALLSSSGCHFGNNEFNQIMKTTSLPTRSFLIILAFLFCRAALAQPATPGNAIRLDGATGYVSTSGLFVNPQTLTITVWFNTTTTQGGRLVGLGDAQTGLSINYDRHLYMDNAGHINFGIYNGGYEVITNTVACNDGQWHQAVGTLSSATGLSLYIDGTLATNDAAFNAAQIYNGSWKVGFDRMTGWPNAPASPYFNGTIDEVQIWNIAQTSTEIQSNCHLFRTGAELGLMAYWHFNEGAGITTTNASLNDIGPPNNGTLQGGASWVVSTAPVGLPVLTNASVSNITISGASFQGSSLPNYQPTEVWFQYGPTTNYGFASAQSEVNATNATFVSVSENVVQLMEGALCHYQLVAANDAGTNFGEDMTFSTLSPPGVTTLPPTRLAGNGATLNGSINPGGVAANAWFEWGLTTSYGNTTPATAVGSGNSAVPVTARISGVQGGQAYHYHLAATNALGKFVGVDQIFEVPLLALYGDNPLTNCFGVPFVDPGFGLAPASPLAIAASDNGELGTEEDDFSLALKGNGTVVAWGYNGNGVTNIPPGLSNVTAIAAGGRFSLALETDGTVVSWGAVSSAIPSSLSNVVAIAAGDDFSLALQSNGTVVGWGENFDGETNIPPGLSNVVAISAGDDFGLALQSDGIVVSWGYNGRGANTPPAGLSNVVAIAAGHEFSLALQSDGTVVGWGFNDFDETPIPSGLTNVVAIAVGAYFGMALQTDGTIVGWGNDPGLGGPQQGWNITGNREEVVGASKLGLPGGTPALQSDTLVAIAAGNDFSLAFTGDGVIAGGGDNAYGNLNIPSSVNNSSDAITITGAVNVNVPGVYTLVYTVTNFMGASDTVTRTVVVTPPPSPPTNFTIAETARQQFALQFSGNSNAGYSVLTTTNLTSPPADWTLLGPATSLSNNLFQFIDTTATNLPVRYYMLRSP